MVLAMKENDDAQSAMVPEELTGTARRVVVGHLVWRRTFAALKHRNFRLFFFGQLVSLTGTWMQNTAQGWLVYQLTGSKMLLGVVAAVGSLPMLLFGVWGGSVADRYPKRAVLLGTQTWMMLMALALAVLVAGGWVRPWHIVVIAAGTGLGMAFDMPVRQSFMVEMSSREDLMNAISLNSSIVNGARVIGPATAGLLMAKVGIAACFFLNGLSFLGVIAGLWMMRLPPRAAPRHTGSTWQHVAEGLRYAYSQRRIRILVMLLAVVGIFGWSYAVLMPAFARDLLHVSETGYGVLLGANGVGALAGALTVATVGSLMKPRVMVLGGLGWFAAMLLLLSQAHSYGLAICLQAASGAGVMLFFSTSNTLVQLSASDEMRGRVMGIWALVFGGMMPLGGMEAGMLAHACGVRVAMATGATVCALAGLLTWWFVRHREPASWQAHGGGKSHG
jgi:MFS family permease